MGNSIHRLSAIVFTDIVGYTSIMGEDEAKALHVLQINRKIHEENFKNFYCTFYKQMGDGFLAVFDSAIDAVYASGKILADCKEKNIQIRIGIHEGEVVFKDNDVFGDEVNIASRIEQSAQSNTIYISENIKRLIDNKSGLYTQFIKEFILKNVKDPVRIYALEVDENKISVLRHPKLKPFDEFIKKIKLNRIYLILLLIFVLIFSFYQSSPILQFFKSRIQNKSTIEIAGKSMAVLPFENLSRNADLNYLGDGFADDIIINLSKIPEFTVIARSSSFKYRNSEVSLKRISRDLGVENIIEGGFQVVNNDIHINIKLIQCNSGNVLLAESYDGQLDDIFRLQGDVASGITNVLVGSFYKSQASNQKVEKINLQAFKYYQSGQSLLKENYLSRNTILVSREQFKKAIKEDSTWSAPYAGLAESFLMDIHYGYKSFLQQKDSLEYCISLASLINPEQWELYYLRGLLAFFSFELRNSEILLNKAKELNPNYPFIYYYLAWLHLNQNNLGSMKENMNKAINLDPLNEYYKVIGALLLSFSGEHEMAVNTLTRMLEKEPGNNTTLFILGSVYSNMGLYKKALKTLKQRSVGHNTNFMVAYNYGKTGEIKKAREILDYLLQLPDENAPPPTQIAIIYLGLGENEKALKWYQKGFENYDSWLGWSGQNWSDQIREDPRFIEISNSTRMN